MKEEKTKDKAKHSKSGFFQKKWVRWVRIGLIAVGGLLGAVVVGFLVVFYTPFFPDARTQYILMTLHTSNPWLATAFFSEETISQVLEENKVEAPEGNTDPGLIQVGGTTASTSQGTATTTAPTTTVTGTSTTKASSATTTTRATTTTTTRKPTTTAKPAQEPRVMFPVAPRAEEGKYEVTPLYSDDGMDILQIPGDGYVARLIRVADPSRVSLGITKDFMKRGEKLHNMCERLGAIAGINAGGFDDPGGHGKGGVPTRICVKDYEILFTDGEKTHKIIGFNADNVLILGEFTDEEIREQRIRDAVAFGPYLILNEEKATTFGAAGGKDPRAAIGQTADGMVLLLTVDGRQIGMEGANMKQVMDILWDFGAVNAANLDGGSSTTMALNGEVINKPCGPAGARYLPNGWIVK